MTTVSRMCLGRRGAPLTLGVLLLGGGHFADAAPMVADSQLPDDGELRAALRLGALGFVRFRGVGAQCLLTHVVLFQR